MNIIPSVRRVGRCIVASLRIHHPDGNIDVIQPASEGFISNRQEMLDLLRHISTLKEYLTLLEAQVVRGWKEVEKEQQEKADSA